MSNCVIIFRMETKYTQKQSFGYVVGAFLAPAYFVVVLVLSIFVIRL